MLDVFVTSLIVCFLNIFIAYLYFKKIGSKVAPTDEEKGDDDYQRMNDYTPKVDVNPNSLRNMM